MRAKLLWIIRAYREAGVDYSWKLSASMPRCVEMECSEDYGATHVKLAALPSLPGAPVNFVHFGHSQSGRERFALGLPSIAVRPDGACPCSTHACNAVRLSIFALNGPKPWPKPAIM